MVVESYLEAWKLRMLLLVLPPTLCTTQDHAIAAWWLTPVSYTIVFNVMIFFVFRATIAFSGLGISATIVNVSLDRTSLGFDSATDTQGQEG